MNSGTPPSLPNLVLAGAPKSGSTALHRHLQSHPNCLMTTPKDTYFFARESNRDRLQEYTSFVPTGASPDPSPVLGEATVDYFYEPEVPRRLAEWLPEPPRLLFVLRDPIERAISDFWHRHKKFNDSRDLEQVFRLSARDPNRTLERERDRVRLAYERGAIRTDALRDRSEHPLVHFCYLAKSFYSAYLQRFLKRFDRSRIHVLLSEELRDQPETTLERVWEFLELPPHNPDNLDASHNPTIVPREGGVFTLVHRVLRPVFGTMFTGTKPRVLRRIYHRFTFRDKPPTPAHLRDRFRRLFKRERDLLREQFDLPTDRYWDL